MSTAVLERLRCRGCGKEPSSAELLHGLQGALNARHVTKVRLL
jgi:hypothetical protein